MLLRVALRRAGSAIPDEARLAVRSHAVAVHVRRHMVTHRAEAHKADARRGGRCCVGRRRRLGLGYCVAPQAGCKVVALVASAELVELIVDGDNVETIIKNDEPPTKMVSNEEVERMEYLCADGTSYSCFSNSSVCTPGSAVYCDFSVDLVKKITDPEYPATLKKTFLR